MTDETTQERISERRREREARARELADAGFDGPYALESGGLFGMGAFAPSMSYAICIGTDDRLGCGAMVRLDDAVEKEDRVIERSASLHLAWHARTDPKEET